MTPSSFLRSRNGKGFLLLFLIVGLGLIIYFRNVMNHPVDNQSIRQGSPSVSGEGEETTNGNLQDEKVPPLIILPQQPVTTEGNSLQITCISSGNPLPTVKFNFSSLSQNLQSHIQLYEQPGLVVVTFEAVEVGHEGVYTCEATGTNGEIKEGSVKVTVLHKGEVAEMRGVTKTTNAVISTSTPTNSSITMATKSPPVSIATNSSEETATSFKQEQRGKTQQEQVEKYCQKYGMSDIKYKLPQTDQWTFNRHMLLNDKSKTLFCFAPKVGCTNLKVLFYVAQGFIPESELTKSRDSVSQGKLEKAMKEHSFIGHTATERTFYLTHYFKFMMYRNPLLRLISGYRSKVQRFPLVGFKPQSPHYNWLRLHTYQYKHPEEYNKWKAEGGTRQVNISFSDFIDYWLSGPHELRGDEHFRPITELCHPCRTRFDFYGNFNSFEEDSTVLIQHIGAKPDYLRNGYYSDTTTTDYLSSSYYDPLSEEQRKGVFNKLAIELDFYYHIFPEELDVHKQILGITDDIPNTLH